MTSQIEILYVEDNPADIELTIHAFKKNHLANNILVAHDGEEALEYIFGMSLIGRILTRRSRPNVYQA